MMKRLPILILSMLVSVSMLAQNKSDRRWYDYDRKNYAGVRLGMSASQLMLNGMNEAGSTSRVGWNVGVVVGQQIGVAGVPLFLEGGLHLVQKQVDASWIDASGPSPMRLKLTRNYIEIPLVFKYKVSAGIDDLTIQPFAGGFLAVGVNGQTRIYPDKKENRRKVDTFGKDFMRRMDAGLRMGCGIAYQNFYFEMSYDIGLANVARDNCQYFGYDSFDNVMRTGCFCASIGLDF